MAVTVISYPNISADDAQWIENIRETADKLYHENIEPHFTLVFPFRGIVHDQVLEFVEQQVKDYPKIPFVLRSALPMKDVTSDYTHLFLVPDEGMSSIIKLHDHLYTDVLSKKLDLEIPFVPHITVGYARSGDTCKEVADELNAQNFEIKGTIDKITVLKTSTRSHETIGEFPLA